MGLQHSPRIVTDGLVLCLDAADKNSYPGSGNTWTDLSGQGNNGTLRNTPSFNSNNKGNITFDGSNESTTISSIIPNTGDFTVGFVFMLTGSGGRGGLFERKPNIPYNGFSLGQGGTNNWAFTVSGTSDFSNNRLSIPFSFPVLNNWYFDVCTYSNGNSVSAYRNGIFINSSTGVNQGDLSTQGSRTNFLIANRDDDNTAFLPCRVAHVILYNRALTAQEIQQNYNATKTRFGL